VKEYYDVVYIVWLHDEQCHGMIEKLGAYASMVTFTIDGKENTELIENENFTIVDEIVHQHVEESN